LTTAAATAAAVRAGDTSVLAIVEATLARIARVDPRVGAFTDVTAGRARARAAALDARLAAGEDIGPLAGVPFAVKNLIDIAGLPTRAGSKINRERASAARDGALVRRLEAAGAVLVGGLNMGEYAYDFTGENCHDGPSRNPHALEHMTGGSSGGSGAAVAAGLVPLALGSDTNGSIRVPSAFCGTFGLKPTYGRLSRAGSFPFVGSLDHLGPLAASVGDLALSYDAMQGADPGDPHLADRPSEPALPSLDQGIAGLRIAVADGYFERGADADAASAVRKVAEALGVTRRVTIPLAAEARAAAYVITAAEGAALHRERLQSRADDFDPAVRDRLLAGVAIPAGWVERAQKFRRVFRDRVRALYQEIDIILAPSTPCRAPRIGQATITIDGVAVPARPNIGLFTQPISFIGLPVAAVPVWIDAGMPLGVQVIAAPWREADALRVARALEASFVATAKMAAL
jgi:1-carboxybiuret hydrolase